MLFRLLDGVGSGILILEGSHSTRLLFISVPDDVVPWWVDDVPMVPNNQVDSRRVKLEVGQQNCECWMES